MARTRTHNYVSMHSDVRRIATPKKTEGDVERKEEKDEKYNWRSLALIKGINERKEEKLKKVEIPERSRRHLCWGKNVSRYSHTSLRDITTRKQNLFSYVDWNYCRRMNKSSSHGWHALF
jgi:hypothetical protein